MIDRDGSDDDDDGIIKVEKWIFDDESDDLGNKGVPRKWRNLKSRMEEKEVKKKRRKKEVERL